MVKAVRLTPTGLRVTETELTAPCATVTVAAAGICGTDVMFVAGLLPSAATFTLGHEVAGYVDGEPYAVRTSVTCGDCDPCRSGHPQRCTGPHACIGVFTDGGMAEQFRAPVHTLLPLPPGLDVRDACLVEPAAIAGHGVTRAGIVDGERAAVRAAGNRLGATAVDGGYDVVFDAAGGPSAAADCARLCRPGGRVVVLGVYPTDIPVPSEATLVKELTWTAAIAYGTDRAGHDEFAQAAQLLAGDSTIAATLITHRYPLAAAEHAFRIAGDRSAGALKVVLHP
jgi:threonine dehydrogenase-like Zn-dependent dehydrogenase